MLHPGLYEQVINNALESELSEIPEARKSAAPLLPAPAGRTAPLGDRPRTVVVGAVAARRRHRAGALAARIFPGTDRPNRIAMNYYVTDNTGASVALNDIPEVSYAAFYEDLRVKLSDARYHAAHYFALPSGDRMRFFLLLLDDAERRVLITSHATDYYDETALPSLTALHPQMHPFERDISERYGIRFDGMP